MSIKELAELVGVSSSLLSQIERGLANPSLNTLRSISDALDVPIFSLFMTEDNEIGAVEVVKKNDRINIKDGDTEEKNVELRYDLLSPDLKGAIQLCEMRLAPGEVNSINLNRHNAEEVAVCTVGEITLILNDKSIVLEKGDSVRIEKNTGHKWKNNTKDISAIIFAISPPIF